MNFPELFSLFFTMQAIMHGPKSHIRVPVLRRAGSRPAGRSISPFPIRFPPIVCALFFFAGRAARQHQPIDRPVGSIECIAHPAVRKRAARRAASSVCVCVRAYVCVFAGSFASSAGGGPLFLFPFCCIFRLIALSCKQRLCVCVCVRIIYRPFSIEHERWGRRFIARFFRRICRLPTVRVHTRTNVSVTLR